MTQRSRGACVLAFLMTGCAMDPLSDDAVTMIAPGDGQGADLTGPYTAEWLTTSCEGSCLGTLVTDDVLFSPCDVGWREITPVRVAQADGTLQLDVFDSTTLAQLRGGVWQDLRFDVGGLRTVHAGQFAIAARVEGRWSPGGLPIMARTRTTSRLGNAGTDCVSTLEFSIY